MRKLNTYRVQCGDMSWREIGPDTKILRTLYSEIETEDFANKKIRKGYQGYRLSVVSL